MNRSTRECAPPAPGTPVELPDEYGRACLLALLHEQPCSGFDLGNRLAERGLAARPGRLAVTLLAFHRAGLVRAGNEGDAAGASDRTYRLTPAGIARLDVAADGLRGTRDRLGWFLARCGEWTVRGGGDPDSSSSGANPGEARVRGAEITAMHAADSRLKDAGMS